MAYFSKRHYALVSPKSDTKTDIARRLILNRLTEELQSEIAAMVITPENAQDVANFISRRTNENNAKAMAAYPAETK